MKIRTKLFFVILSFAALLVLAMYGFSRWKFEDGFLHYVQQAELARLSGLVEALGREHAANGSWQRLQDGDDAWVELIAKNLSFRRQRDPAPHHKRPDDGHRWVPPDLLGRLVLVNADFGPIINHNHHEGASWEPILVGDRLVGYLGLLPRRELREQLDKVFMAQQTQVLGWVAAGAFLFALITAQLLARSLSRPLSELAAGTKVLAGGDFRFRLPVNSRDELGQLCADFNSLASSLEKNQTDRQTWLATFSHELRTPLAILQGEIDAMLEGVRPLNPAALQSLREEAQRVSRLVDDLYELSRSALGTLSYRKAAVDLVALIEQQVKPELITGQLRFELALPDEAWAWGDAARLTQLIRNLLQNTVRYSREQGRVRVRLTQQAGEWLLSWEDDGPGVPEDALVKIFEPFFRLPNQTHASGAGLGLAICRNIVEAHEGQIQARKAALGGLEIQIRLPVFEGDQ